MDMYGYVYEGFELNLPFDALLTYTFVPSRLSSRSSKKLSPLHSKPINALTSPPGRLKRSGLESLKSNV